MTKAVVYLFLLHDFEEIICVPLWKIRHREMLGAMSKPFFGSVTNGHVLSVGILEEMFILLIASIICSLNDNYTLYLAFVIVYALHFIMHYKMCLSVKNMFLVSYQQHFSFLLLYG